MSPQAFESCIKRGGRVRTKSLKGGKYLHICILNGKSFAGEVKEKKGTASFLEDKGREK